MDANYEPRTLLEAFDEGPIAYTFLRDTFFGGREFPPTNLVEFDFRRGRRRMAPFVAPLVGGKIMERGGYETRFFRAPRIAPVRALRIPDLEARLPGETVYEGRTAADRAADLLAEDAIFLDEAITRREEWMCRCLLINGKISVTADNGYEYLIDFLENSTGSPANNHKTITTKWDAAGSDPLTDLEEARIDTIKDSGISPNIVLMGKSVKAAFLANDEVRAVLDLRRFEMGNVAPVIQSPAVVRFATVPGLELYSYNEYFEDDAGTTYPMLPDAVCFMASTNVQNKIVYGAFTQLEDAKAKRYVTYQTSRIPFIYGDEEQGHLFYRLTSQPLPMPSDILGWRIIEALTGSGGPFTMERPFFASEDELDERTVDQLKEIADKEGADLTGITLKADIVKAIKKNRQNPE